jgi:hypothetical protein
MEANIGKNFSLERNFDFLLGSLGSKALESSDEGHRYPEINP